MYVRDIHFPFDRERILDTKTQPRESGDGQDARSFGLCRESEEYLVLLRGGLEEGGETGLGCVVREGRVGGRKSRQIKA